MEDVKIKGTVTINNMELIKVFDRINRNLLTVNKKVGIFEEVLPKIIIYKNRVINEIIDKYSLNSSYECCVKIIVYEKEFKKDLEEELVKELDSIIKTIEDIVKENIKKYNIQIIEYFKNLIEKNKYKIDLS